MPICSRLAARALGERKAETPAYGAREGEAASSTTSRSGIAEIASVVGGRVMVVIVRVGFRAEDRTWVTERGGAKGAGESSGQRHGPLWHSAVLG